VKVVDAKKLLENLCAEPRETSWLEFKASYFNADEVGRYVSGLANAAILEGQSRAYLVYGVENDTHKIIGTEVSLKDEKVGNEIFEHWLTRGLDPRLTVDFVSLDYKGKRVELILIDPAYQRPVRFRQIAYIWVDSILKELREYPERERSLWIATSRFAFERGIAAHHIALAQLYELFDPEQFLAMLGQQRASQARMAQRLVEMGYLINDRQGAYDVTNLFALLAGKDLSTFPSLATKAPRVIQYKGRKKLDGVGDVTGRLGYALGFGKLLAYIMSRMPHTEIMVMGVRKNSYPVPEIAIREFVANALIHQDFTLPGHPTIEVFDNKIQITNPGSPLVDVSRFIDAPSKSRNEALASSMRAIGLCEERGSGVDRALSAIEEEALPAPLFQAIENSTVVNVFRPQDFSAMSREDRIRACYQHAQLRFENGTPMSNQSLRRRLGVSDRQYPQISVVIKDAIEARLIRPLDLEQSNRKARYVPHYI